MGAKIKAYLQALYVKLTTDVGQLWQTDKGFVILFGVVILAIKFHSILIDLIVSNSKAIFDSTKKTSDVLQKKEDDANAQANHLVENAKKLPESEVPIDDDWNKK